MPLQLTKTTGLHIVEVGVGDTFTSKSRSFWADPNNRVQLFEPNPLLYASLLGAVGSLPNVRLHHVAVAESARLGWLVSAGVLSYLADTDPSPINTIFRGKLTPMLEAFRVPVPVMTFDAFDAAADIDILILGMEGGEAGVFPALRSRPHVIILNNHFANDYRYAFPRFEVIQRWCETNGYHISAGIPDITLINLHSLQTGALTQIP